MIVRKNLDPRIVFRVAWKRMSLLLLISSGVTLVYHYFGEQQLAIDNLPASILGVALAILIGFRINNAYERWWEARRLWGNIVNESRNISRQVLSFFSPGASDGLEKLVVQREKRKFIYRQIAFAVALKNHLRKLPARQELEPFLDEEEFKNLEGQQHLPNAILLLHAKHLERLRELNIVDDFRQMQIDTKISALCDALGGCERIKNTVFPRQYSVYATSFIALYSYLLPFVFVSKSGWATIPFTMIIGFIFFALDSIARGIENPFENNYNDTPMTALCRTIEINLKEMIREEKLPEPVQPVNGFLY